MPKDRFTWAPGGYPWQSAWSCMHASCDPYVYINMCNYSTVLSIRSGSLRHFHVHITWPVSLMRSHEWHLKHLNVQWRLLQPLVPRAAIWRERDDDSLNVIDNEIKLWAWTIRMPAVLNDQCHSRRVARAFSRVTITEIAGTFWSLVETAGLWCRIVHTDQDIHDRADDLCWSSGDSAPTRIVISRPLIRPAGISATISLQQNSATYFWLVGWSSQI